jgi:hypothetical protein
MIDKLGSINVAYLCVYVGLTEAPPSTACPRDNSDHSWRQFGVQLSADLKHRYMVTGHVSMNELICRTTAFASGWHINTRSAM